MTNRVKQFWLPSLLTLLFSMGLLALIQVFGPNPMAGRPEERLVSRCSRRGGLSSLAAVIALDRCDGSLSFKSGRRLSTRGVRFYRFFLSCLIWSFFVVALR